MPIYNPDNLSVFHIIDSSIKIGSDAYCTEITANLMLDRELIRTLKKRKPTVANDEIDDILVTYNAEKYIIFITVRGPNLPPTTIPMRRTERANLYRALRSTIFDMFRVTPEQRLNMLRTENNLPLMKFRSFPQPKARCPEEDHHGK